MASKMMISSTSIMALLVLALIASIAKADVECSSVILKVFPCQGFVAGGDATPSTACCAGLQDLDKDAAASQPDKRAICRCLKDVAKNFPVNFDKANQLPKLCNLAIKITIDPNINCDTI